MMLTRVLSACVLLALLYGLLTYLPAVYSSSVISALVLLLAYEWGRLVIQDSALCAWFFAICVALFAYGAQRVFSPAMMQAYSMLVTSAWCIAFLALLCTRLRQALVQIVPRWLTVSLSLAFAFGALISFALVLYALFPHLWALILLVAIVDSGAYISGKAFGRHKFAPTISPHKTWEGVCGGLLLAVCAVLMLQWYQAAVMSDVLLSAVAVFMLGVFAIAGDLLQSQLKRFAGVKDSGAIIPGHGGIFDRLDALLAVAPVYWLTLQVVPSLPLF